VGGFRYNVDTCLRPRGVTGLVVVRKLIHNPSITAVRFGVFELDLQTGELRKQGMKLRLQGQPIQILAMLLENAGSVVMREELRQKLWPADTFVDFDHGLNNSIQKLREVLGDSADTPRYIETLPRKGYRFLRSVETLPTPSTVPTSTQATAGNAVVAAVQLRTPPTPGSPAALERGLRRIWLIPVFSVIATTAFLAFYISGVRERLLGRANPREIHSIAVLPLENLTGDPAQEYFADGMTDALITDLAQIGSLRVISRSSAMRYKGVRKPLSEIAKELNVDAVVEGSVARSGNRVRIDAQLIQAPTDRHLWARSYERDLSDVLVLQGDLARAIAAEIQAKMTSQEQQRLANARSINPAAQEDYLKGLYYWGRRPLGLQKGIEFFQQALEKEPTYALPYAGLALSYATMGSWENGILPPREAMPKAKAAGQRALELDDTLSQAHAALAYVQLHYDWDWAAAEKEFQRAIELNRNDPIAHHWYSHYLTAAGRNEESLAESKRAQELDPLDPVISIHLAWLYYYGHHYDKVIEQSQMVLEANPQSFWPHFDLGWAYEQKGMFERAIAEFQKTRTLSPASTFATAGLGHAYGMAGNRAEAVQILRELIEQSKKGYVPAFDVAVVYEGIGDDEHAFEWVEKAYAERSSWLVYLKQDPRFDSLHSNPHFQDLLRRVGVPRE